MTREDILAQLATGHLQPHALCWRLGMAEWLPISTLQVPEEPAPQPEAQAPIFPDASTPQKPVFPSAPAPVFPAAPDPVTTPEAVFPSSPAAAPEAVFPAPATEPIFPPAKEEPVFPATTAPQPLFAHPSQFPDTPALFSQTPAQAAATTPRQGPPPLPPRQPRAAGTPPPLPPKRTPTDSSAQRPPSHRPAAPRGQKASHRYLYAAAASVLLIGLGLWYWVKSEPQRLYQKAQVARSTASPEEVVRLLQLAADRGHPQAMAELATCHRFGTGTPQDLTRAFQLYLKAAEHGNPTGQLQTGLCLAAGIGIRINNSQAIQWLERAAENGHPDGPYHIAAYYFDQPTPDLHQKGVTLLQKASSQGHLTAQGHYHWYLHQQQPTLDTIRSLMKAAETGDALSQYFYAQTFQDLYGHIADVPSYTLWLEKAAAQHLPRALIALGQLQESNQAPTRDPAKALDYYNQALQLGSLEAHLHIGRLQFRSQGSPETQRTALEHYLTAAQSHLPEAQYQLGTLYQTSPHIPQDLKQAKKWYEAAAEGGSAAAKNALGTLFEKGLGVPKDLNRAYLYFKSAADQDDAQGYYELYRFQFYVIGNAEDRPAALKNLQKAAQKNNPSGLYNLGFAQEHGRYGLPQDLGQAYANFEKAANLGLSRAQYRLATWYFEGKHLPQDNAKAIQWLQKAAAQNDGPALLYLSHLYKNGTIFPADPAQYQTYLRRAADQKYPPAMTELAFAIFNKEEGIQGSIEEANALITESANLNDTEACYRLGLFQITKAIPQNFPLAIEWLTKAAQGGHLGAQIDLIVIYTKGSAPFKKETPTPPGLPKKAFQNPDNDIPPNPQEAFRWCRLAAAQGDPGSQCTLGQAYLYAEGTSFDLPQAIHWLQKAADQKDTEAYYYLGIAQLKNEHPQESTEAFRQGAELGDAECQYQYASALDDGIGTPKDLTKAFTWMEKSARQGYINAIHELYLKLTYGIGTSKNFLKANRWLDLLAAAGVARAQIILATDLQEGKYLRKQNTPAAIEWLQKAADQNAPLALNNLGACYQIGIGVPKDLARAQEYYQKAAERGNKSSQYQRALHLIANADGSNIAPLIDAYCWLKLADRKTEEAQKALFTVLQALTADQIDDADQSIANFKPIKDEPEPPDYLPEDLPLPK